MNPVRGVIAIVGASAILLLLASCASSPDEGGPDPGLRGQWELNSATDAPGVIPLGNQHVSLTIDGDTTTTGRSTCSDYVAHVYGTLSTLWITAAIRRARACGSEIQAKIEHRYLHDLNQVRTSRLTGGVLDLTAPGIDLTFVRALTVPLDRILDRT